MSPQPVASVVNQPLFGYDGRCFCQKNCLRRRQLLNLSLSSSSLSCHAMSCHVIIRAYVGRCVMGVRIAATARNLRESGRARIRRRWSQSPSATTSPRDGRDVAARGEVPDDGRRSWRRVWIAATARAADGHAKTKIKQKNPVIPRLAGWLSATAPTCVRPWRHRAGGRGA